MRKHKRVYEVAKEHRLSSEMLMSILPSLNVDVKRHTDRIEDADLDRVEAWLREHPDGAAAPPAEDDGTAPAEQASAPPAAETPPAPVEQPLPKPRTLPPTMPPSQFGQRTFMPPVQTTPPPPPPPRPETRREEPRPAAESPRRAESAPTAQRQDAARPANQQARPSAPDRRPERRPGEQPRRDERLPVSEKKPDADKKPDRDKKRPVKGEGEGARPPDRGGKPASTGRKTDIDLQEIGGARRVVIGGTRGGQRTGPVPTTGEGGEAARRRRGKRRKKPTVSQQEIQKNVQKTLTEMGRGRVRRRYDRGGHIEEVSEEESNVLRVTEFVSVGELADMMGVKANEVIGTCLKLGIMVTVNQRLDFDSIQIIADEFKFTVERLEAEDVIFEPEEEEDLPENLVPRPPVVTVMGHVDHGKTSLLDYIRRTNVIAGEAGGITQHIGAYEVQASTGRITFLDTPGHEAFTAMRARGAQVTDVVVLVVAADDNVMPQTIEAINHARAAQVPMVVAMNKIDLPAANPDRIKRQLTEHGVIVEEYGGQVQAVPISAKRGDGVDQLLETLALETELLDLKANPNKAARGVVIEARLDRGRGPAATVLIQGGTIKIGDAFAAGLFSGRVRALLDERGNPVEKAGPSQPVQVLGFDDVPTAGDTFVVYEDEREAREVAQYRQQLRRQQEYSRTKKLSLADLKRRITEGELRRLPVIVKGDVDGSVEALSDELAKLSTSEVAIEVIHRGVGAISESDVLLASASSAVIIGFHVRPDVRVRELAAQEQVEIRLYNIIYEAIEELRASLEGMLEAKITEKVTGAAEVRQLFRVPRAGVIAGSMVRSGTITRGSRVRVMRDGTEAYNGRIGTLRRVKEDVREVAAGYECGIWVENFNDVKVGDVLETYDVIEEARTLESVQQQES